MSIFEPLQNYEGGGAVHSFFHLQLSKKFQPRGTVVPCQPALVITTGKGSVVGVKIAVRCRAANKSKHKSGRARPTRSRKMPPLSRPPYRGGAEATFSSARPNSRTPPRRIQTPMRPQVPLPSCGEYCNGPNFLPLVIAPRFLQYLRVHPRTHSNAAKILSVSHE